MEELLALALENPDEAVLQAEQVLATRADPWARSFANQCLGIVYRDRGLTEESVRRLRDALSDAAAAHSPDRRRDVRATYAGALAYAGRTAAALHQFARALDGANGELEATIRMRKAGVLALIGRHADAVPELVRALEVLPATSSVEWQARTRIWLGYLQLCLGHLDVAEREVLRAKEMLRGSEASMLRLTAIENLAEIAVAGGNLARGLQLFGDALAEYAQVGAVPRFVVVDLLAATYLSAGLVADAADLLDKFVGTPLPVVEQAELHLRQSSTLLAAGDLSRAHDIAIRSAEMFQKQGRTWFERRARLVAAASGHDDPDQVISLARALDAESAREAPMALTLAGRLSRPQDRLALWTRAASYRTHPNALVRAAAWHAQSLAHEEQHHRGGVLRAAAAGLDAIDEHRRLIGSSELRALATTHGRDLTTIALRHAATDPRTLLRWSERTRATALAQPPATSDAATIPASLAALRDNGRRLAEARAEGEPTDALERERLRLERAVRSESHTLSATTAEQQKPPTVEEIVAAVGDGCLVELVDVDGTVHVLVTHAGRVRRKVAGSTEEIAALLGPTQMLLRRASRGRATDMSALGGQLQEAILGDAVRLIADGPVVLAPTARLHGLAWPLLPVLGDRPFSVVPSAGQWLRARATPRPAATRRRTVLVSGPGLATGGAEVPLLAASHPDATLLAGRDAALERVLDQLDGADLVHLAAHGNFRADSPLFSALDLADGPLTVHDLERVRRAPYRVVLSACESGVLAPVGAEELLGLAAALFSLGTAGLVSSVAEVNDTATADLMVELHASLASGADPATALHRARRQAADDPVAAGTAAAFLALGV